MMFDESQDDKLRQQFSEWEAPSSADDWEAMAQLLDARDGELEALGSLLADPASLEEPPADSLLWEKEIRYRLEQLSLPPDAQAWARLEGSLDQQAADLRVREAFEAYEIAPQPGDWQALAESLSPPVDALLRQRLDALPQPPPSRRDWHRLERALHGRRSLPVYRYAASLLLLFSVALLWQAQRYGRAPLAHPYVSAEVALPPAYPSPQPLPEKAGRPRPSVIRGLPPQPPARLTDELLAPAEEALPPALVEALPSPPPPEAGPPAPWLDPALPYRKIRHLPLRDADIGNPALASGAVSPARGARRKPLNLKLSLFGFLSATRAELSGAEAGPGYGTGLRAEFPFHPKWSVVAGLINTRKRFSYEFFVILDRPYPHAIDGDIHAIEAPLAARYYFQKHKRLSFYGQFGVAPMVSLDETYAHYDPNTPANRGLVNTSPRMLQPEIEQRKLRSYPGQVFASVGLSLRASKRISFEVEPYFQQGLQRTRGSGASQVEKKLSTPGLGFAAVYHFQKGVTL
jgi:hypothetical protein